MRVLAAAIALFTAGAALGAEKPALPERYLQDQAFFAGHWRGTGNIGDDQATIEFTGRWAPGKHCLVLHGTTSIAGKPPVKWSLLSGCDGKTEEMVDCSFGADGTWSVTRWKSLSADEQQGTETGIRDGESYSLECRAIKHGRDAWSYTSTTPDGKPVKIEYQRVTDKEAKGKK